MDIGNIQQVDIDAQMRDAYLDYAMSVIVARSKTRSPAYFICHARYGHPRQFILQKIRPYCR